MINEELIKRIILEKPRVKEYIKRDVKLTDIDKVFTIIGPRRAGKTYFLFQIMDILKAKGISDDRILYINFEDERLSDIKREDLHKIIDIYYTLWPENKRKTVYFMFDEIQNIPAWSKFIRRLYDKEKCKIYITGSSAKLLSKEIATELRGRTWTYYIYPFSFKEFLKAKGLKLNKTSIYSKDRYKIIKLFETYLNSGGFPEVVDLGENERCIILQNYHDTVMFRDIIERYKISNIDIVKDMFKFLINNFARPFSVNKFYNILKSMNRPVSKDYLYSITSYLEDTFYFLFVPVYTNSAKIRMVNPKKSYVIDNGLVQCLMTKTTEEKGWFYENLTAIELARRGYEMTYFKNECDFIAFDRIKKEVIPIQVTLEPNNPREINGLLEAMKKLKLKKGIMITESTDKITRIDGKTIQYIPLWKWLLKF
ncbi:ATP-binding protein [Candidatus Micrarchaeota archaeon]|nr:ATP-binding protein [Candidatus Micrarchaeota archaeon]